MISRGVKISTLHNTVLMLSWNLNGNARLVKSFMSSIHVLICSCRYSLHLTRLSHQRNTLCNFSRTRSRKLSNSLGITCTIDASSAALSLVVLAGSVLLDLVAPAELVLDLTTLDALKLLQELDASGTRLIAAVLELELVAARAHGDALDGNESCGGACGHDLVEGGDFFVFDLLGDISV